MKHSKLWLEAFDRCDGACECYGCGAYYINQMHHIVKGKGKRTQCERIESVLFLCWDHHYGNYGIHGTNGHALDIKLKLDLQDRYYEMGMTEDEVRKWMGGKIYNENS